MPCDAIASFATHWNGLRTLSISFKRTQLSGVELDRKTFGDDYGEPLKIKRILNVANVIASIAIVLSGTTRSATASRSKTGKATSGS
ncbi:hypothetical protein ACEUZ9_002439 [Paracoccus litorisediminis]|uniref:Uncharacterized protein n=1 Tax=Paracoccus litorisediminis TaxID=2006130 RepID=A0A844HKP6_9RHOB|nr:hypothetical protein [Paracoccus litorisediminis]MTH59568.1 hypothetical protein [Paracoccus litorisediminis]